MRPLVGVDADEHRHLVCLLVVGVGHHGGTPDEEGALASFEPHRGRSTGEQAVRSSANPRAAGTYRASSPEPLTLRASPQCVPFTLHQARACGRSTVATAPLHWHTRN